ncbi:MAG: T9SS type A sorting domain-containing protein [Chitinophagales bacterium]|jgi:hypothetical protein|nr:T9SS type A sorting domain-containing protein [Bacteroidota bacterium]MBP8249040.1 T9SS type A sorting domain-containing protein [Chitinophagales bacterium]
MRLPILASLLLVTGVAFAQAPYKTQGTIEPGTWTVLSDMNESRNGHTTTYLADGKVLVTGGYDGTQNLASAEIYDPATDTWTPTGDMDSIRFSHTATLLDNGKVLIIGGWNGGFLDYKSTLLYDPASGTFTHGPDMKYGRSGHTATKLNNGKILIVGGYSNISGNTTVVEIYDPVTNTLGEFASLNKGRSYHTATIVGDGRVVVAAGFNPDYGYQMNSTEIYDPVLNTWTEIGNLGTPRDFAAAVYVEAENAVFLIGGRIFNGFEYEGITSVEKLSLSGDSWVDFDPIPEPQSYIQAFAFYWFDYDVYMPCMLVPGGTNASGFGVDLTFSGTYAYDFVVQEWIEVPMFFHDRYYYAADQNQQDFIGDIIVTGGEGGTVELFKATEFININNALNNTLSLSPNPAGNYIDITLSAEKEVNNIEVFNMMGDVVLQVNNVYPTQNKIALDIHHLPTGNYVVKASGNNQITSGTFIKE